MFKKYELEIHKNEEFRTTRIILTKDGNYRAVKVVGELARILDGMAMEIDNLSSNPPVVPPIEERSTQQHVEWCKYRALEYLYKGDHRNAVTSMISDLGKHTEFVGNATAFAGLAMFSMGSFSEAKKFIDGF